MHGVPDRSFASCSTTINQADGLVRRNAVVTTRYGGRERRPDPATSLIYGITKIQRRILWSIGSRGGLKPSLFVSRFRAIRFLPQVGGHVPMTSKVEQYLFLLRRHYARLASRQSRSHSKCKD